MVLRRAGGGDGLEMRWLPAGGSRAAGDRDVAAGSTAARPAADVAAGVGGVVAGGSPAIGAAGGCTAHCGSSSDDTANLINSVNCCLSTTTMMLWQRQTVRLFPAAAPPLLVPGWRVGGHAPRRTRGVDPRPDVIRCRGPRDSRP